MSKQVPVVLRLKEVGGKLAVAESLVDRLREERDQLLLQAREEDPSLSVQKLADTAGMRREAAHYAIQRAKVQRAEGVTA